MEETLRETSEERVAARVREVEAVPSKKEVEDHSFTTQCSGDGVHVA